MGMPNEDGHGAMLKASMEWKRIRASDRRPTWSEWTMIIGPGLIEARAEALGMTGSNRPRGRAYNTAMSALVKQYGLDDINKTRRVHLFKIMRELHHIEAWRAGQKNPDDLNNPSTVWDAYQRSAHRRGDLNCFPGR
jgi:hypothetical protein